MGNWEGGVVWRITSGCFLSNAYFCDTGTADGGVLIDPGLDGPAIDTELCELGVRPHQICCTHGHFDHSGSASYFQKKYGCQVFLHKADERTILSSNFLLMALQIPFKVVLPDVTYVDNNHVIAVGCQQLTYLATPGHTPGSCILELGSVWFTGDTLYSHGVGLSSLPGEDQERLKTSILGLWPCMTGERTICPGHGEETDGETIRMNNLKLQKFIGITPP